MNILSYLKLKKSPTVPLEQANAARAVRFRLMLEQLGPTFIKLGQILSTRADLLPADIVAELSNLQDSVTPTPWHKIKAQLPKGFEQNFVDFDHQPIASASLSQVYAAKLKTGEKVAVKILRPGTEKTVKDDIGILEHLGSLAVAHIEEAGQWNPHGIIEQFKDTIGRELNLEHEGRNADIFRANFAGDASIYVPKIYWQYSCRNILVMELIDGEPMARFFDDRTDIETRKNLARIGANAVLKQIFEHGFFQADPHPGNALVLPGDVVICFLDFGMFGRLDDGSLDLLARVLQASVKKDVNRLIRAGRDLGVLADQTNQTKLRIDLLDLMEQYHGIPLKQLNIRQLLGDIVQLVNRHHLGIRHDFLLLIKALGTIEATGKKLDGDFDMVAYVEPFVRSLLIKRLSPQKMIDQAKLFAEDLSQLTRESPEHVLEIMRKLRSGKVKLEFHHKGLEGPFAQFNQMLDKVTLGLIIAAFIIASALIAHSRMGPTFHGYSVIGGIGFLGGVIAGGWIFYDILISKKK